MVKGKILFITVFLLVFPSLVFAADETLTITTYYPSPYGSYQELTAQQMKIGRTYSQSTTSVSPDNLIVEGSVGIGTKTPGTPLEVVRTASDGQEVITVKGRYSGNPTPSGGIGIDWAATYWGTSLYQSGNKVFTAESNYGVLIGQNYQGQNAPANGAIIEGNVGIGTATPAAPLHVYTTGNNRETLILQNWNSNYTSYYPSIVFKAAQSDTYRTGKIYSSFLTGGSWADAAIRFAVPGDSSGTLRDAMTIRYGGNVGIGTTNPSTRLEVNSPAAGAIKIVDTTQAAGRVLTSDANGVGTWQSTVVTGTYIGNDAANRTINLGFTPSFVIIEGMFQSSSWTDMGSEAFVWSTGAKINAFVYDRAYSHNTTDTIIVTNGFRVSAAHMNNSGISYFYTAYK